MKTILWYRKDLRIHDHTALYVAMQQNKEIEAVYFFNLANEKEDEYGFRKCGMFRKKFLEESLSELQLNLNKLNIRLHVIKCNGFDEFIKIIKDFGIEQMMFHYCYGTEEKEEENQMKDFCTKYRIKLTGFHSHTLIHPNDLAFEPSKMPKQFTAFRKKVEHQLNIRKENSIENWSGKISFEKDNSSNFSNDNLMNYKGGETEALKRLKYYFFDTHSIAKYKETRNGMVGADYSSKFSAWLSLGCISPRRIYYELKLYEDEYIKNESTYWLFFELLWRDFFNLWVYLNPVVYFPFFKNNFKITMGELNHFEKWKNGCTGNDFIDANMLELLNTGFMSNRGRQNVASYLIHDLKINWVLGAKWFEEQLIDYDVCCNYGNWCYLAGVGNDSRENRYFNTERQAEIYDADKKFRNLWLK